VTARWRMADDSSAAVILVRHLANGGPNPLYPGGGSIGIIGAAHRRTRSQRSHLVIGSIPSQRDGDAAGPGYQLLDAPEHGFAQVEWDTTTVTYTAVDSVGGGRVGGRARRTTTERSL
jgi:hypothetical protein